MKRGAGVLGRLIALPLSIAGGVLRLLWGGLLWLSGPLRRRVDASPRFGSALNSLSSSIASQRGVPLLIGTALVALSLVAGGLVIALLVAAGRYDASLFWLCIPAVLLHLGILAGFVGIMLAVPLGQGYRDR
jgi:hypothetical protein